MWVWKADLSLDNNWIQQSRQRSFLSTQSNKQGQREEARKGLKELLLLFGHTCKDEVFSFSERPRSVQPRQQAPSAQPAPRAAAPHIHLCPEPFLALKWRTVRLKFLRAAATFKLIRDQDRSLSCWTWVLMANEPISAQPWFEKQQFWKGRFLESLPLQHLQLWTDETTANNIHLLQLD